jgi:O-antigen/teichoic acid export membrane protein
MRAISFNHVIGNFLTYASGALLFRGINFLIVPISMHILTPSDYGTLALMHSFINMAAAITGLGLRQALSLEYFHYDEAYRKQLVNDVLTIYTYVMVPLLMLAAYYNTAWAPYISLMHIAPHTRILCFVIVFISFFVELLYQIMQYEQVAKLLTLLHIIVATVTTGVAIAFLTYTQHGAASIVMAQLSSMGCALIVGAHAYQKNKYHNHFSFTRSACKIGEFIQLGLPFVPTVLFGWLLASGDRWVLAHYSSLENVGIYSLADTSTQLFQFFILYPWSGSYLPYILSEYTRNKDNLRAIEQFNKRVMALSMATLTVIIVGGFYLTKPLLAYFIPTHYQDALHYVLPLFIGKIFLLGSYFASSFIQFHKKRYFLSFILCVPALLNIGLNCVLIPRYEIHGCVLATVISYIVYFALTLWYSCFLQQKYA